MLSDFSSVTVRHGMRMLGLLALLVVASFSPAQGTDYSPWDRPGGVIEVLTELAQKQGTCCKHCTKGQPCGNTCISAKVKCKRPPGCAC